MNIAPMVAHGWKFELSGSQLILSSEENPQTQLQVNARAAYSLLDYLYQYREDLHDEAKREEEELVAQQKQEPTTGGQEEADETIT